MQLLLLWWLPWRLELRLTLLAERQGVLLLLLRSIVARASSCFCNLAGDLECFRFQPTFGFLCLSESLIHVVQGRVEFRSCSVAMLLS